MEVIASQNWRIFEHTLCGRVLSAQPSRGGGRVQFRVGADNWSIYSRPENGVYCWRRPRNFDFISLQIVLLHHNTKTARINAAIEYALQRSCIIRSSTVL